MRERDPLGFRRRNVFLATVAIIGISWGAVQGFDQEEKEQQLRRRITEYWDAMQKQDYRTAARYIHPDSRDFFEHRVPKSRIDGWRIQKLAFNADATACEATMVVVKPVAIFGTSLDWKLRNEWVLVDSEWFFKLPWDENDNPMLEIFRGQQETSTRTGDLVENRPPARTSAERRILASTPRTLTPDRSNPTTVQYGQKAVFKYHFRNKTAAPVRVVSVHSDCHCTSVPKEYPEVPPGEEGTIEVTLDTFGLPLGPIEKVIQVTFADLQRTLTLRLSVENLPNFVLTPSGKVDFGEIPAGQSGEKIVKFLNRSGRTVTILSKLNSNPSLSVSVSKTTVLPDEEITVSFRFKPSNAGEFADSVMLRTDLEAEPLVSILVHGRVGS
jgi:hypothetical protein